ncbi:MAG TPA: sodium/solute symporter [Candidatus Hydrogenedentes bacterium]|nr:sodium/solute symporter [Candidatus Hydrogenedentota bacterium]HNT86991.1 sodium/solute symporter [Candidatus Hydrogenedentota bacterium]
METIGLAPIDIVIIGTYMLGSVLLGLFCTRYVGNANDFFISGKALPFWAIGFSIVVSDIGAVDFVAVAGATYTHGVSAANFDWMGSMPAMVFAAFVFVPYFWRSGVFTIPEFLGRRYNTAVQFVNGFIWTVVLMVMLAVMLWVTADKLMYTVLGWDPMWALWIMALVTGLYTFSGGLTAVVFTDVVQLVVMYVGGLGLLGVALWEVGGWTSLREQILAMGPEYQNHFTILLPHDTTGPFPWTGIVFGLGIVLAIAYMSGNQVIVQRTLGARTEWDAKGGMLLGGFLKSFIPLMVALPGLCALVLVPHLDNADRAVPEMIRLLLPAGLRGLMFAALFAALMSSISGTLNSSTTIFVTDLYGQVRHWLRWKPITERQGLTLGRLFTAMFIILAAVLAKPIGDNESIYVFIQTVLSLFQGPTLAILLLGIIWRRATGWGGLAGLVLGVIFCFVLKYTPNLFPSDDPFLFVAWWSFVFSVIVTVVVSLLTPPEPDEKIRGLVWSSVVQDDEAQAALRERISG